MSVAIVWFRQDLRLRDNPALVAAAASGLPVIPLYLWAPEDEGNWPPGAASRWWLHHSLQALNDALGTRGSQLIFRRGSAAVEIPRLATEVGASLVCWSRRYEPAAQALERTLTAKLEEAGCAVANGNSALLIEPWELTNATGKPYRVFTPFKRRLLRDLEVPRPANVPRLLAPAKWPRSHTLKSFELLPKIAWDAEFASAWTPGEAQAQKTAARFIKAKLQDYPIARNRPDLASGTTRLSPHLHFGEIGPRQIWHMLGPERRSTSFVAELVWREFAYHLLHHFPHTPEEPLRPEFAHFPWRRDKSALAAWQQGRTGLPIVDAGMLELWRIGWMHNRVRMITASFLVKNLRLPWQVGSRWFWETLVDADLANNTLNWQWIAGSGADAAPYFRIFNPERQAERFDPQRRYIGQWAPHSARLKPIIDLAASREAALEAYQTMRAKRAQPD